MPLIYLLIFHLSLRKLGDLESEKSSLNICFLSFHIESDSQMRQYQWNHGNLCLVSPTISQRKSPWSYGNNWGSFPLACHCESDRSKTKKQTNCSCFLQFHYFMSLTIWNSIIWVLFTLKLFGLYFQQQHCFTQDIGHWQFICNCEKRSFLQSHFNILLITKIPFSHLLCLTMYLLKNFGLSCNHNVAISWDSSSGTFQNHYGKPGVCN